MSAGEKLCGQGPVGIWDADASASEHEQAAAICRQCPMRLACKPSTTRTEGMYGGLMWEHGRPFTLERWHTTHSIHRPAASVPPLQERRCVVETCGKIFTFRSKKADLRITCSSECARARTLELKKVWHRRNRAPSAAKKAV